MTLYSGILARIEALGERPDMATLDSIDRTLEEVFSLRPANGGPTRAYTRSLDAALSLVERKLPGDIRWIVRIATTAWELCKEPVSALPRHVLITFLKALIAKGEG